MAQMTGTHEPLRTGKVAKETTRPSMPMLKLTPPKVAFVVATRAALGVGIGLLLSEKLPRSTRRALGVGLVALGALTTIPAIHTLATSAR